MIEVKYSICDRLSFFNTAACRVEEAEVKGVRVIPTGVSRDAEGRNVLDGYVVLYQMDNEMVLAECELFRSADECRDHYRTFFQGLSAG